MLYDGIRNLVLYKKGRLLVYHRLYKRLYPEPCVKTIVSKPFYANDGIRNLVLKRWITNHVFIQTMVYGTLHKYDCTFGNSQCIYY